MAAAGNGQAAMALAAPAVLALAAAASAAIVGSGDDGGDSEGSDSDGNSLQASYCDSDSAGSDSDSNDGRSRGNGKKRPPPSQNASKRDNTRGGKALDKATRSDGEWNLKGIREGQFDNLARKQTHIDRPHYSPRKFDQL